MCYIWQHTVNTADSGTPPFKIIQIDFDLNSVRKCKWKLHHFRRIFKLFLLLSSCWCTELKSVEKIFFDCLPVFFGLLCCLQPHLSPNIIPQEEGSVHLLHTFAITRYRFLPLQANAPHTVTVFISLYSAVVGADLRPYSMDILSLEDHKTP